jgi:hypothetical protein
MADGERVVSCTLCSSKALKYAYFVKCKGVCGDYVHLKCAGIVDSGGVICASFVAEKWICKVCCDSPGAENTGAESMAPVPAMNDDLQLPSQPTEEENSHVSSLAPQETIPPKKGNSKAQNVAKINKNVEKRAWSRVADVPNVNKNPVGAAEKQSGTTGNDDADGEGWVEVSHRSTGSKNKTSSRAPAYDIFVQAAKAEEKNEARQIVKDTIPQPEARKHVRDIVTTKNGVIVCCRSEESKAAVSEMLRVGDRLKQQAARGFASRRARVVVHGAYIVDFPQPNNISAEENKKYVMDEVKANNLPEKSEIFVEAIYSMKPWGHRPRLDEMVKILLSVDDATKQILLRRRV